MTNLSNSTPEKKRAWLYDLLLVGVLLVGGYLRLAGSGWGELSSQHPDENFLEGVTNAIQPVHNLAEYFNSETSTLNPVNVGHGFYVYGDLPLFIVRGLANLTHAGNIRLFGRQMSAVADLATVALLYFIVKRLYGPRVAILAAMFSALAVMQIQQSHFYTTDFSVAFFMILTLYFAVEIVAGGGAKKQDQVEPGQVSTLSRIASSFSRLVRDRLLWLSAAFGIAAGMAMASKLNAAPLVFLLPVALAIRYFGEAPADPQDGDRTTAVRRPSFEGLLGRNFIYVVVGAIFTVLSFRVFQPYAFSGLWFDPQWLATIRDLRNQGSPNADMPWSLQWARRTHLFSFQNLTVWGLGLPLGILAWSGFLWMGWRILKGGWRKHLLLWVWTGGYFLWQSLQYNPTMRYQLPIYPLLAMMAAWGIYELAGWKPKTPKRVNLPAICAAILGSVVLVLTAGWAYAFSRVYVNTEPRIAASKWIYQNVPGPINLEIQTADGTIYQQPVQFQDGTVIQPDLPYQIAFVAHRDGTLASILLNRVKDTTPSGTQTLNLSISTNPDSQSGQALASASVTADFTPTADARGNAYTLTLDQPLAVQNNQTYYLFIKTTGGALTLTGSAVTNETDFDYPIPLSTGFYGYGGNYTTPAFNGAYYLQVYWDDNTDKLARFVGILDQSDYIFIPTNHQYGQITRIPERYPLTTVYYRELLGCPPEKNIISCYYAAEPGTYHGSLGFDLVAVFTDYPTIGPLVINDQTAEEAFTFYDHPKVLIFKKNADYSSARVQAILGAVDTSKAVHLTPAQADNYKSLMLPADKLAEQQAGGTWSELFNRNAFYNRYPGLGVVLWYLVIFLLGLFTYPLIRAVFPGLADHGYPLSRFAGLLIWAWFAWMAGSIGLTYSKLTIGIALGLIVLIGLWQAWRQRAELKQEFKERWKYFLMVEIVFLSFFLLDLFIRLGNPDLWHPWKGGERPMDFAYFNAILKSTSFPPYDPWYAGGYINYYYYGYVIVGTPVKLLGIVPSIAYNFILPTLFACLAAGAFSVAWNLLSKDEGKMQESEKFRIQPSALIAGLAAAAAMVLLGNLGILRMVYQGFQQVATAGGPIDHANIFQHIWWTLKGFYMTLGGQHLPFGPGDWYWFPSRALPASSGDPITEFPAFSFIFSDLHAHVMALPITVLAIAWVQSVLMAKARWKTHLDTAIGLLLGGLIIGALKPTNTWDFYTYLILGAVVLAYAVWRYADISRFNLALPDWGKRLILAGGAVVTLAAASLLFYQFFTHWFLLDPGYTKVLPWTGGRSNISSYLVHWGVFLFFVVSWMIWETRQWLAETPVSALRKLKPYWGLILSGLVVFVLALVAQQAWVMSARQNVPWKGITILWLAMPLAAWAAVLIFRPAMPDAKRLVLFIIGTSLLLTMVVELIVMGGDIGRMNTVFKFYNQAWVILGLCAAAAFGWLLTEIRKWLPGWQAVWQVAATILTAGAALFLLMGGMGKIKDRMIPDAPHTLDSMTYMAYAHYAEPYLLPAFTDMDLNQDYRAILWMQDNIQGSPVIAEAPSSGIQYYWLNRFSIYTGLPDVVGWEWHQVQQRVLFSGDVINRGRVEEDGFYTTTDISAAMKFLSKYNVRYIIVGQLERGKYTPANPGDPNGLDKFVTYNGLLWNEVYRDGQTVIYKVLAEGEVNP